MRRDGIVYDPNILVRVWVGKFIGVRLKSYYLLFTKCGSDSYLLYVTVKPEYTYYFLMKQNWHYKYRHFRSRNLIKLEKYYVSTTLVLILIFWPDRQFSITIQNGGYIRVIKQKCYLSPPQFECLKVECNEGS